MKLRFSLLIAVFVLAFGACKKDDTDQALVDKQLIEAYLLENNITAQQHESGMYYVITTEGSGDSPTINSTVEVKYKGYFLDGAVFDQTTGNQTVTFPLNNLIEGWKIAIPLLKRGGKGTFFLPSALGYGSNPPPGIPSNAVLIFDIELIDF